MIATAAAALVRLALSGLLGDRAPFFTFVLAVLIVASYGGFKPGLLATVLGAVLGRFLFVAPLYSLRFESSGDAIQVTLYLLSGVTASWLCGALRAARRHAEAEQRQQLAAEEQVRSVVNNIVDGIITIDSSGNIESMNPAAENLFGYKTAEVVGHNVKLLMPEPFHGQHDDYLFRYLRTGRAKIIGIGREVEGRRKDGSKFPMDLAVSEFWSGQHRYFTGIVRDITQRKHAEQQIHELLGELKKTDLHKNQFVAILAHELRNTLAPLRGAVELLQLESPINPKTQKVLDIANQQLAQVTRLVDDLSDLSRIMADQISIYKERLELASVVTSAVESSRAFLDAAGHRLAVRFTPEPIYVEADPIRLTQVFQNLLSNAAKYTSPNGNISLTAHRHDGHAWVSVKDDGIGISADAMVHIFDIFARGDHSSGRRTDGLGIGLALVRRLVEMHGGTVEAHSEGVGKGSEFIVRLPIIIEPLAEPGRFAVG